MPAQPAGVESNLAEGGTDRALVARAQAGDSRAFDALVLRYQHKLLKLIGRYVRDQDEAQDVAQESFLKAFRALPNFRGDSAFYTWLYRIAINTAKNHLVSLSRRPMDVDVDATEGTRYAVESKLTDQATPERLLVKSQIETTVASAIEDLPEELRIAISLRELEGLSYEEIAAAMDCPIGTVRSRIFRAREAINQRLSPLLD